MKTPPGQIADQEIMDACRAFHADIHRVPTPEEALAYKYSEEAILAKMDQMVDAGILEYGVSLRTAWVAE